MIDYRIGYACPVGVTLDSVFPLTAKACGGSLGIAGHIGFILSRSVVVGGLDNGINDLVCPS